MTFYLNINKGSDQRLLQLVLGLFYDNRWTVMTDSINRPLKLSVTNGYQCFMMEKLMPQLLFLCIKNALDTVFYTLHNDN